VKSLIIFINLYFNTHYLTRDLIWLINLISPQLLMIPLLPRAPANVVELWPGTSDSDLSTIPYTIYPVMSSYRRSDSGAVSRFSRTSDFGAWELTRYRVSHTRSWAIWLNASFYSIFNMWNYWQSIGQCKQRLTFWSGGISSHIL